MATYWGGPPSIREKWSYYFFVNEFLMCSPSKDKIDELYASLQAGFKIEYDGYLNKCLDIELDRHSYGSIHLRQNYLTQIILNIIPGMDKSSATPTHAVNTPPSKK